MGRHPIKKDRSVPTMGVQVEVPKTTAASLIRSLNECDTLLLESKQCLGLFASSEMCTTLSVLSVGKLIDKLEGKLTAQSVEALTQGWEPGQPENRGCELVTDMKSMLTSLVPAKALASCLQAKRGQEDPMGLASVTGSFKLWIMVCMLVPTNHEHTMNFFLFDRFQHRILGSGVKSL